MSSYVKHKKKVSGISDMKKLAEMIGDLHYETLKDLLFELSEKIFENGQKDFCNGKIKLAERLHMAQSKIRAAKDCIESAWYISKPFMKNQLSQPKVE